MNKTNLELKHYCANFKKIREILKEIGAKKEIVKNQKDYFFNLSKKSDSPGRLKLRLENNTKTLVYYERPDFVKSKNTISKVTLYNVADNQLLHFLIETFGIQAIVEKKREVWRKDNAVFHLDTVKNVGDIFEVELQKIGVINNKDRALFASYQKVLTPFLGKVIKGSNIDLVNHKK